MSRGLLRALICAHSLVLAAACARTPTSSPDASPPPPPVASPVPAPTVESTSNQHDILAGAWSPEQQQAILAKTREITLSPDLSTLTAGERACVDKLLAVGDIMQRLYEDSLHHQAAAAREAVASMPADSGLRRLYDLFQGPIATTLDNQRTAFLGVEPERAGKNVYPVSADKAAIEAYLGRHSEQRPSFVHLRTVVRAATPDNVAVDLAALDRYPMLDGLHPGLRDNVEAARQDPQGFYAVPYAVAYADELVAAYHLLLEAADAVAPDDPAFARYLRNRARDLLTNDYESGDAAWVTSTFGHLNAQIGAYEVYPDQLYGTKAFFSLSLLVRDEAASQELASAITDLQTFEDSLPYKQQKRVRSNIAVGVYNVVADFGQARGRNTASILPNEAYLTRQYGRTILLRANIMRNPELFASSHDSWVAAVDPRHHADLGPDGGFYRTLWHEIGHYLGVDTTHDGRTLDVALQENSSAFEEMKADLVSLYVAKALRKSGYHDDARLRSIYASGIRRTLQSVRPRRSQPYQTMQLMQFNYFLAHGLLAFDPATGKLRIDYRRYHQVVRSLLAEVLEIQRAGDKAQSDAFIERYTTWDEQVHGAIAQSMQVSEQYPYSIMRYDAVGQ